MKTRKSTSRSQVAEWKSSICNVCLSRNRTLNSLGNLTDIYEIVCQSIVLVNAADIYLCWECLNLLKKVHEFRKKVQKSHKRLSKRSINVRSCPLTSLSNLSISEILTFDTFEDGSENDTDVENSKEYDIDIEDIGLDVSKKKGISNEENIEKTEEIDNETNVEFVEESGEINIETSEEFVEKSEEVNNETIEESEGINIKTNEELVEESEEENNKTTEELVEETDEFEEKDSDKAKEYTESDYNDEIDIEPHNRNTKLRKKTIIKNYPEERSQQYTITYQSLKWKTYVRKRRINDEELKQCLESEKNSDYFKSLKNKCYTCLQKLKINEDKESHERECHTTSACLPYSCGICGLHYPRKSLLAGHIRRHYCVRECSVCGYQCHCARHMRYHFNKAHAKRVRCVHCGDRFKNTRDFYVHLKSHSRWSCCDKCGKRYSSLHSLHEHIHRKHEEQRCEDCDITFKSYIQRSNHMKLKHTSDPRELSFCAPCNKQFNNQFAYKKHLLSAAVHIKERGDKRNKEVACPVCLKVYSKRQTMMNHYRWVHTKDSRYKCEHCDKSFLNRTRYKDHLMFVHLGRERPRDKVCQFCNKAFTTNQSLRHHVLIHTGEKPHACPRCPQRFRQRSAMTSHLAHLHIYNQ